jgi:hypothetical protein
VLKAREFLLQLARSHDDRAPHDIRHRAELLLRYFPDDEDIGLVCGALPHFWQLVRLAPSGNGEQIQEGK